MCGLILSSRKVVQGINWAKTLEGKEDCAALAEKGKGNFGGHEIVGKTLGIVGLGAIGIKVANAAEDLGMDVIGYDPFLSVDGGRALRLNTGDKITVTRSSYTTKLLRLTERSFFEIIKNKFK